MKINIPQKAAQILKTLNAAGYEAYVVGGCVRDSILGREPGDWDITTSALPEQVKELFRRTVDTGIQHGTVTVMMDKEGFEVTTYRVDGEYHDGRHPDAVTFTRSLEEDLKRRDFTINAMAYHPEHGLVDLFGGMEDIGKRIIRCVGNPVERFTEDALRMLRAVRFSAQLGFTVEENTKAALARMSGNLEHVSAERIQTHLFCNICGGNQKVWIFLYIHFGLFNHIIRIFNFANCLLILCVGNITDFFYKLYSACKFFIKNLRHQITYAMICKQNLPVISAK